MVGSNRGRVMVMGLLGALAVATFGSATSEAATFGGTPSVGGGPEGNGALYQAATGERNDVTFTELTIDGYLWVRATELSAAALTYSGVPTYAGACVQEASSQVRCPARFLWGGVTSMGGDGNDTIDATGVTDFRVFSYGEDGNDVLTGGWYVSDLYGGAGNDRLQTQADLPNSTFPGIATSVFGGPGSDTIDYGNRSVVFYPNGVTVDLTPDADGAGYGTTNGTDGHPDQIKDVENIVGSPTDDTLTGNSQANVIVGCRGDDTISGETAATLTSQADILADWFWIGAPGACVAGGTNTFNGERGPDTIIPNSTNDAVHGGNADGYNDTVMYTLVTQGVVLFMNTTPNTQGGWGAPGGAIDGIENVIGSNFDDLLVGSSLGNVINGGPGKDFIFGDLGSDRLTGGPGQDRLWGSGFSQEPAYVTDTYFVEDGEADTVNCALTAGNLKGDVPDPIDSFTNCTF